MATVQANHQLIEGKCYGVFPNPDANKPVLDHLIDHLGTANGTFRWCQLVDRVCKAVALVLEEMNSSLACFYSDVARKIGAACNVMSYARLPAVTRDFCAALSDWSSPQDASNRASIDRINTLFDGASAWSYVIAGFFGSTSIKTVAELLGVVSSAADLTTACDDWNMSKKNFNLLNGLNSPDLQKRFAETQTQAFWRIVKNVSSIASGVLGLLVLALGGPILPAAVMLGISLTSTIAALSAHFAKKTSEYEMVDFYKVRQPQVCLSGQLAH